MLQVKQQSLATALGSDWNQKKISQLEDKETIDPAILEEVAKALNVPVDAIKNFDPQAAIYNIQNNYEGANTGVASVSIANYNCTFNPLDELLKTIEENKKLYERLLQAEKEKVALLEKMLNK